MTSIGARVYLEAFTTRNTNALVGVSNEMTDELGVVAVVLPCRLELPEAEAEPEFVDCDSDSLVPFAAWELTLLRELGGRSGDSLLSGNCEAR